SNALIRSDATSSSRSSSSRYRSRTLPDRTYASASGDIAHLRRESPDARRESLGKAVEARDDLGHVAQERRSVEARIQPGERQALGDDGVDGKQVAHRGSLIRGAEGGALDDRIGLVPTEPGFLDEREEHARRGVEPEAAFDVLAHPLGPD